MTNHRLSLGLALILCVGLPAQARPEEQQSQATSWDRYKVLAERNMFLRDRAAAQRAASRAAPVYPPEHFIVLTGIVRQGEEYIAFLEDTRSKATSRVGADGPAAQGRIVRVALDYVEYEKDGQTLKVEMGQSLEGGPPGRPAAPDTSAAAGAAADKSAGTAPPAANAGSEDENAVLERLRQRRQKELNAK